MPHEKSYYQRLIRKNYNPNKETLSEEEFSQIVSDWEVGLPGAKEKLCEKTCYLAYDHVCDLFVNGVLHSDFEEALQNTYLLVREIWEYNLITRRVNLKLSGDFKNYKHCIERYIKLGLKIIEKNQKENCFDPQSDKRTSYFENPECVVIKKENREELISIIDNLPLAKNEEIRKRRVDEFKKYFFEDMTGYDVAKENNKSHHSIYQNIRHGCRKMRFTDNVKELLR